MKHVSDFQKKRAVNQIWNAAGNYDFSPDFKVFDAEGQADLYWNSIVGAAHRHYEYDKLEKLFSAFQQYEDADTYEGLLWLGLENCVFLREVGERPVLSTLREHYAKAFVAAHSTAQLDDYRLYDCLALAHFLRVTGREPAMNRYDKKLLDELEFSPELSTDEIVQKAEELFARWFQISAEERRRERRWLQFSLNRRGKAKGRPRLRQFGIGLADHSGRAYGAEDESEREELRTKMSAEELREFMTGKYGLPVYGEQQIAELERKLCIGSHESCHLHVTKGEPFPGRINNGFEALQKQREAEQIEKNRRYYRADLARNRANTERLAGKIQNSVLLHLHPAYVKSNSGSINGRTVWRAPLLHDEMVFVRQEQGDMGDLSVDILLDASTSQKNRQEIISGQGYMIAQALTRCGVPCRVMSFCSMTGYTILRIFRDYNAPWENERIFEYVSNGCNRDGLAIRTVHHLMGQSPCANRLLIVLSDVKPHDVLKMPSRQDGDRIPYERDAGVTDTAYEVRAARADGIAVVCVFTGEDEDLPSAKLVYGRDFARIPSVDKLADTVGMLIQNQIRNL